MWSHEITKWKELIAINIPVPSEDNAKLSCNSRATVKVFPLNEFPSQLGLRYHFGFFSICLDNMMHESLGLGISYDV